MASKMVAAKEIPIYYFDSFLPYFGQYAYLCWVQWMESKGLEKTVALVTSNTVNV